MGKVIDSHKSSSRRFLSTVEIAEARKWWILLVQNATIDALMSKDKRVRKSLNTVTKKLFTRDFIMHFTAFRKVERKELLKEYYICLCLTGKNCIILIKIKDL